MWPEIWEIYWDSELIWFAVPFLVLSPSPLLPNRTIPALCIAAPSRPCLLRFQGRGPTCRSCWAADWLAAALHEGWVKWQTGPHDPAQPDGRLFQELCFFSKYCSHLLSPGPPTTPSSHQLSENSDIQQPLHSFSVASAALFLPLQVPLFLPSWIWIKCEKSRTFKRLNTLSF